MFSPAVGCGGLPPFFYLFYLTKAPIMLYYKRQEDKMKNARLWLLVDSSLKKLLNARHWTTSQDSYKEDIEIAIEALERAKKKLEEE